jgi:hypothetical protein
MLLVNKEFPSNGQRIEPRTYQLVGRSAYYSKPHIREVERGWLRKSFLQ